jgi:translocation and assembly module TamB
MWRAVGIGVLLLGGAAQAQEDDRDYLTAFLEDTLSDAGRTVTVTGFAGALSTQATVEQLTIADDQGIWITLNDVVLDWSQSALLSGVVEVSELSAAEIIVARLPATGDSALPSPEASGFSLPDLPVSISIDRIAAGRIELGPEVLGQAVTGTLGAALQLADGQGEASLRLLRTDAGAKGEITLDAAYANATRQLSLSLNAKEGAEGIVVGLLGIPGRPAAKLTLTGAGAIEDFQADITLATDGEARLTGQLAIREEPQKGYRLLAEVAGNLAPIMAPDHVDFFGTEVSLKLDALRSDLGRVVVERFDVVARSVSLSGSAELAPDGLPERIDVTGRLASPDGQPVLLPFGETPTRVASADFRLVALQGGQEGWTGDLVIQGLDRSDVRLQRLELSGSGRIARTPAGNSLGGSVQLKAKGIEPADPGLAVALGDSVEGALRLHFLEGSDALSVSDIQLTGAGLAVGGSLQIAGLRDGFLTSGTLRVTADDFSRFALLAGRDIGGSGSLEVKGSASRLSGFFDVQADFAGKALRVGIDQADRLLVGESSLRASVRRDETGTALRSFALVSGGLTANAGGKLSSKGSTLAGKVALADLAALGPGYGGSLSAEGGFEGSLAEGRLRLTALADALRIGNREADRLLAGTSRLSADLLLRDGVIQIDAAALENRQVTATAKGEIAGATRRVELSARLANLGLLVPEVEGPLTLSGTALQDAEGYEIDLSGKGPGEVNASVTGRLANTFGSAALDIRGTAEAGLANLFISPRSVSGAVGYDLRLEGPLRLASLSGRMTLSDGRIADPGLGLSLDQVQAIGQLGNGRIRVSATSGVSSGGRLRIDGPISLTPPYDADLALTVDGVRLYDPELFDTRMSGGLTITGPLRGGALIAGILGLSDTEIQVPSTGLTSAAELANIRHINEPAEVRLTRAKAGLLGGGAGSTDRDSAEGGFRLDLTISAPSRVFVRGRGIDAELGGDLRLTGTTGNVIPSGAFRLIRGRLDILGRRLVLSRADLQLEGSLEPTILVEASTESDGITSLVTVEGPAGAPEIRFSSSPDLPQEEALARLLFGRGLDSISPLQAAQLANAVAVLAGRGGIGLVDKLRQSFGLDDLDVVAAEDGSTALKAGKYISDNVYTEIELGADGKSRVNLNLDLREGVTVKGRLGADGETGIGIFVERDY